MSRGIELKNGKFYEKTRPGQTLTKAHVMEAIDQLEEEVDRLQSELTIAKGNNLPYTKKGVFIKDGVRFVSPVAAMSVADLVIAQIYMTWDYHCTFTCGIEKHEPPSKHVTGAARDYRTRHMSPGDRDQLASNVQQRLGDSFDVVLESDHLHVEYDPKS